MRQRPGTLFAASLVLYTILTALIGHRVLSSLSTAIANDWGDPVFTAMLLQWNATHVPYAAPWWQLPIFYPTRDTLAFSEHLLGLSVIATPLYWLTGNAITTYNLTMLLTFPLCAGAMYALVWRITGSVAGAFVAGLAFGFAPYRVSHLPHIQMLAVFWAPLAILGLHAYVETGRRRWLALYAGAWALQGATNSYSLVLLSLLLGFWVVWFVAARRKWRELAMIAVATVVAFVPLAPIVHAFLGVHERYGFVRTVSEIREFSADIAAVLCAPGQLTFWNWLRVHCRPEGDLFPGVAVIGIGVIGLLRLASREHTEAAPLANPSVLRRGILLLRRALLTVAALYAAIMLSVLLIGAWRIDLGIVRISASSLTKPFVIFLGASIAALLLSSGVRESARRSSLVGFYLVAAVLAWMLALGPTLTFMGRSLSVAGPFTWLLALPGVDGLRVPARFWFVSVLCLSAAAGIVTAEMLRDASRRAIAVVVAIVAAIILTDGWVQIPVDEAPLPVANPHRLAGKVVIEVPTGDTKIDIAAQFRAVQGGWLSVNGYSGYSTTYYPALSDALRHEEDTAFPALRDLAEIHVVVPRAAQGLRALVERQPGAVLTAEGTWDTQYRLPRQSFGSPAQPAGRQLPIANVRSSCSTDVLPAVVDRDERTIWRCDLENARQDLIADLGDVTMVGTAVHRLGAYFWEFPRHLSIDTSEDGVTWRTARSGNVLAEVIRGGIENPRSLAVVLPFAPRAARYVRFRHYGRPNLVGWTVAEIEIWTGLDG